VIAMTAAALAPLGDLLAHGDQTAGGPTEPLGWAVQPGPLVGLLMAGVAYLLLVLAAARRGRQVPAGRVLAFASGLVVVALALFSPLDPYGEARSPAAHMLQHELLLMVAPLLLVVGVDQRVTLPLSRWVFGPAVRSGPWRALLAVLGHPFVVTAAWCAMVIGWHVPFVYDLALDNDRVHIAEHACLLTVGLGFWVMAVGRLPSVHRTTTGQRLGALAGAMGASGALAAVLAWSPGLLYPSYAEARPWFGLTPVQDQRLAAAVMMAVDMPLLLGAALLVAARWARQQDRLGAGRSRRFPLVPGGVAERPEIGALSADG
jgi:cytochrome c oxidase assembly factor CtaG